MDRREDILVRLLAVLRTVGAATVERNLQVADDGNFPALQMMDGDEEADDSPFGRARPPNAPNMIAMTPHVHILLGEVPEDVGTELNRWRVRLLKAVLNDTALGNLVTTNGEIRYEALAVSLQRGRQIIGEMGLVFTFVYPLKPAEL